MQIGWDRYVGPTPNFFRTGTVNGHSLNKTGTFFIEQEFNGYMLNDGSKNLFVFPKFKEFIKSISDYI